MKFCRTGVVKQLVEPNLRFLVMYDTYLLIMYVVTVLLPLQIPILVNRSPQKLFRKPV